MVFTFVKRTGWALLASLLMAAAAAATAQPAANPSGFNAPDGYYPASSKTERFARYEKVDTYICLPRKKHCNEQDPGFTAKGYPGAEGAMVTTIYKRHDGQVAEGLLLQRNYERVIREMGGRLLAVMSGQDERRGYMRQVHLLDRDGQRHWILVDTSSDSRAMMLLIVTLGATPNILSASEMLRQIDSQGFATLNVNFETNKADLRDADQPTIDQVVQLLKDSPRLHLSVDGHTDNVGQAGDNKALSQRRAQAIVDHLVAAGIARDRLVANGFGMERPVADNRSEEGRAKNRRVELVKMAEGAAAQAAVLTVTATASPAALVELIPPESLRDFLKKHPKAVVLFTSPSLKCGYCVGADKTFADAVAQLDSTEWRYVRTEWSPWNKYPPIAVDAGVLGIPDHVVFRLDRPPVHVSGRIQNTQELADKIRAVQNQP